MLGGHIHFIISHIHQGLENFGWNITHMYSELDRLKYHPGYPMGQKLQCPIFTQDKWNYHGILPESMKLKTVKLHMSKDMNLSDMDAVINRLENSFLHHIRLITLLFTRMNKQCYGYWKELYLEGPIRNEFKALQVFCSHRGASTDRVQADL